MQIALSVSPCALMWGSGQNHLLSFSLTGTALPAGLTFARASEATDIVNGTLTSFATDAPRLNPLGMLFEGQRTNLAKNNGLGALLYGATRQTGVADPLGGTQAIGVLEDTATIAHFAANTLGSISYTSGTKYGYSAFVKRGHRRFVQLFTSSTTSPTTAPYANFDLDTATVTASETTALQPFIKALNGGWYWIGYSFIAGATGASSCYTCSLETGLEGRVPAFTGAGAGAGVAYYVWGHQVEALYGVSSYVPTTTAAVTRSTDVLSITDPTTIPYAAGRITFTARTASFHQSGTDVQTLFSFGNATEGVVIAKNASGNLVVTSTGFTSGVALDAGAVGFDSEVTVGLTWDGLSWTLSLNGTDTVGFGDFFSSGLTYAKIGANDSDINHWFGRVKTVKVYGESSTLLREFSYEPESETFFSAAAALSVEPTELRKNTYNRLVSRLKGYGLWNKLTHLYLLAGATEAITFINVKNPGTNDLVKVGSPIFTADDNWRNTNSVNGNYLDTGIQLNSLSLNFSCGIGLSAASTSTGSDFGAINSSSNGISLRGALAGITYRAMSVNIVPTDVSVNAEENFIFLSVGESVSSCFLNGRVLSSDTPTNATISSTTKISLLSLNVNGTVGGTGRRNTFAFFSNTVLSTEEMQKLMAVVLDYQESVKFGELDYSNAGTGRKTVLADVVIYGATGLGVCAAYEAARQGKRVVICGGWRDRRLGGVSSGGLGFTDFENKNMLGGLSRWIISQMNAIQGVADTSFVFQPRNFSRVVNSLVDSNRNGGKNIPIYWSNGVSSVSKTGTNIKSFSTTDGRTFYGREFIDCSYECDLLRLSGVSYKKGAEAAGTSYEAYNGYSGISQVGSKNKPQWDFADYDDNERIDPHVIEGDTGSGLLPHIEVYNPLSPTMGDETGDVQAYNFRLSFTSSSAVKVPLISSAPSGYNPLEYEIIARKMASNPSWSLTKILKRDELYGGCLDINTRSLGSTDYNGVSIDYPLASYGERERLWKSHWNYILGLIYFLSWSGDSRIPTTVRNSARTLGYHALHYPDHHENDYPFCSPQLYVRETIRMVSDFVLSANDVMNVGEIGSGDYVTFHSYPCDSHFKKLLADYSTGTPRVFAMGQFFFGPNANHGGPIPYEAYVPKASECTNMSVIFGGSFTHTANGACRMEFTAMQAAQSMAVAACLAIDADINIQDVDRATLKATLEASPTLSGEVAPVLEIPA